MTTNTTTSQAKQAAETSTSSPDRRQKHIPAETIIQYANQGLTDREIAKLVGCDRSNITRRLKAANYSKDRQKMYRERLAGVLDVKAYQLIKSITPTDLKKARLSEKTLGACQFIDKAGQLRGNTEVGSVNLIQNLIINGPARKDQLAKQMYERGIDPSSYIQYIDRDSCAAEHDTSDDT